MSKTSGILVAVASLLLLLASALADQLGFGADRSGFGFKQIAGSVIGFVGLVFGILAARRAPSAP